MEVHVQQGARTTRVNKHEATNSGGGPVAGAKLLSPDDLNNVTVWGLLLWRRTAQLWSTHEGIVQSAT